MILVLFTHTAVAVETMELCVTSWGVRVGTFIPMVSTATLVFHPLCLAVCSTYGTPYRLPWAFGGNPFHAIF